MSAKVVRRTVIGLGCLGAGAAAWSLLPRGPRPSLAGDPLRIYAPEGAQLILDPAKTPKVFREAPELAEKVRSGALPPVALRVGQDPLVLLPLEGAGRYGGVMRRAFIGPSDFYSAARFISGPDSLLYWDTNWRHVRPNIARDFKLSSDGRQLTVFLRRGMRWSDGAPFTADDILFWYEDFYSDPRVVPRPSPSLMVDGQQVTIEKIDASTIRFVSPAPYPLLPEVLAGWSDLGGPSVLGKSGLGLFAPRHYLSRFHPRYAPEADLTRQAREQGFANWAMRLKTLNDPALNPDLPVVSPWKTVRPINTDEFVLERNPYSIWVDADGAQLPYIGEVRHTYCSGPDAVNFKAGAGDLDIQDRHLSVAQLPFLLSNRGRTGYSVHLDPYEGTDVALRLNLDYRADPEIGRLLRDVRFRRAMSMACDRAAINDTLMLGLGRPSATVPAPDNRYYPGDAVAQQWAAHDPEAANRLLDEIGLATRDGLGYRIRSDGAGRLRLTCQAFKAHFDYPSVAEMLKEQWRAVGLEMNVEIIDSNLFVQRASAGTIQMGLQPASLEDPFTLPDYLFPATAGTIGGLMGAGYAQWFQSGGARGRRPPKEIADMMALWRMALQAPEPERIAMGRELIRSHVDQVMSIGLISNGPSYYGVRVVSSALANVPRRVINSLALRSPVNSFPMTFFYRDPKRT